MRTNEEIIKILDERRIEKGLSISELARQVEMAKSAVSRYFNLTREFPINRVNDFAKALNLKPEYILGFDDIKKDDILPIYNQLNNSNQSKVIDFSKELLKEQDSKIVDLREWQDIDLYSTLSAGTGVVDLEPTHIERVSYNGYVPKHYDMAFKVQGDSMEPVFEDGEVVFVEVDSEVRNGQFGAVLVNGEAYIKKMYIENDVLRLVSLNKKYDDIIANEDDEIKVVGRVII